MVRGDRQLEIRLDGETIGVNQLREEQLVPHEVGQAAPQYSPLQNLCNGEWWSASMRSSSLTAFSKKHALDTACVAPLARNAAKCTHGPAALLVNGTPRDVGFLDTPTRSALIREVLVRALGMHALEGELR